MLEWRGFYKRREGAFLDMGIVEIILLGISLAMDAFAVSICKGLAMKRATLKNAAIVGLWFGGFQALMPTLGYILGAAFAGYIAQFDHWVAFVLLALIGGNMIKEALSEEEEECGCCQEQASLAFKGMLVLAIATSIDALAVGITFAFLHVNLLLAVVLIGVITFLISAMGVKLGGVFGAKYQSRAELAGGIILILLGLKILLEHLGILTL